MTQDEALMLIEQIKQEEGRRVEAQLTHTDNRGTRHSAVQIKLVPGQRIMRIARSEEWESLKLAWSQIT